MCVHTETRREQLPTQQTNYKSNCRSSLFMFSHVYIHLLSLAKFSHATVYIYIYIYMSERDLKRRVPVGRRLRRPSNHSPSPSSSPAGGRRVSRPANRGLSKPSCPIEIPKRSHSEPALVRVSGTGRSSTDRDRNLSTTPEEEDDGVLFRPKTCEDIFSASSEYSFPPRSPHRSLEVLESILRISLDRIIYLLLFITVFFSISYHLLHQINISHV